MRKIAKKYDDSTEKDGSKPYLAELRKELLLDITSGEKRVPDEAEIKAWILHQYQKNPAVGDIVFSILSINEDLVVEENELSETGDLIKLIALLEKKPLSKRCFMSLTLQNLTRIGVLIERDALEVGGFVHEITMFRPETGLRLASRMEIRACLQHPEPFASLLSDSGWRHFSVNDQADIWQLNLAVRCLRTCHDFKYPRIPLSAVELVPGFSPEIQEDDYFVKLLADAYMDKVPCTQAIVPMDIIEVEDIDFALKFPDQYIKIFMKSMNKGDPQLPEILLHEIDGKLIMFDDYINYLAYLAKGFEEVPAVIVGEYSQPKIRVISRGFSELIPPVRAMRGRETNDSVESDKHLLLKKKLSELGSRVGAATKLEAAYIHFCRILKDGRTNERDIHNFIKNNPNLVDSHAATLLSEVTIGGCRADLLLKYEQSDKKILIIELKRQTQKIFKKGGRLRFQVTNACQQVENCIAEIRRNASKLPSWLDGSYQIEGAVVMGRSADLSAEEQARLFDINGNRQVKIITYDDLLERLKQLIFNLDKLDRVQ